MKKYFSYIRVSTPRQGEKGFSLEAQSEANAVCAKEHGGSIVKQFVDVETASKVGRGEFNRMIKELRLRSVTGVIIHKIDRGARNLKDWSAIGDLIDDGIDVHFSHENIDLRTRGGRLSADLQAVIAADYSRNLREETWKGIYRCFKNGLLPNMAPIGYVDQGLDERKRVKPKALDPVKAPLVTEGLERFSTGRYTIKTMREELHRLGLRGKSGKRISLNVVNHMLRNPFYAGVLRLHRTGEEFLGKHESLISLAVFKRNQAILDGRLSANEIRHRFLFRRFLKCKHCGRSLVGERQKGHVYYRCQVSGCPTKTIREEIVEEAITSAMQAMELTDKEYEFCRSKLKEEMSDWCGGQKHILSTMDLHIKACEAKLDRLTDLYMDQELDSEEYKRRKSNLVRDLAEARRKREEQEHILNPYDELDHFLELSKSFHSRYISANPDEKRELVQNMTSNRLVDGKCVEFAWCSPYAELMNRSETDECCPFRDGPRTFERVFRLLQYGAATTSPTSLMSQ